MHERGREKGDFPSKVTIDPGGRPRRSVGELTKNNASSLVSGPSFFLQQDNGCCCTLSLGYCITLTWAVTMLEIEGCVNMFLVDCKDAESHNHVVPSYSDEFTLISLSLRNCVAAAEKNGQLASFLGLVTRTVCQK